MDIDAIEHMNADHAEVLVDFARYYGSASYDARDAQLTPNTKTSELEIEYRCRDGSRRTCWVPIPQPVTNLRETMKAMAYEASIARIPPFEFAPLRLALPILVLMCLLGISTHATASSLLNSPLSFVLVPFATLVEGVFGSTSFGCAVFYVACVIHVAEGLFVFRKLSALMKADGRGRERVWAWTMQAVLVGGPSILTLLRALTPTGLEDNNSSERGKND